MAAIKRRQAAARDSPVHCTHTAHVVVFGSVFVRRHGPFVAAMLFGAYAYFFAGHGWNQDSRFDLMRTAVEMKTLEITAYHENTGDKSFFEGKYFSDKAPGQALLAIPFVAAAREVLGAMGRYSADPESARWLMYVATLVTSAVPACIMCLCVLAAAEWLGAGHSGAVVAALGLGLSTPVWPYASLLWCHLLAAACIFGCFVVALRLRVPGKWTSDLRWGALLGLLGGVATITEYPAAVSAALMSVLAVYESARIRFGRVLPVGAGIVLGAAPCVVTLLGYNYLLFGSALDIGYQHQVNFSPVVKLFGAPDMDALEKSLFGEWRGLFPLAPALVLGLLATPALLLKRRERSAPLVMLIVPVYYVVLNASYLGWFGGWCYGPRNITTALPFLALPLAHLWSSRGPVVRFLIAFTLVIGAANSFAAVTTSPQPPFQFTSPILQFWWPAFRRGDLSFHDGSFNLGLKAGLSGVTSLMPLLVWFAMVGVLWLASERWRLRVGYRGLVRPH